MTQTPEPIASESILSEPVATTGTRTLDLGSSFRFSATAPTAAVFITEPESSDRVQISNGGWKISPNLASTTYRDSFGNLCRRLVLPVGITTLSWRGIATVPDALDDADPNAIEMWPSDLPDDVLQFTLPSRFCESDVLARQAWKLFGSMTPGYGRVQAICTWVHSYLSYVTGSTIATDTAVNAFTTGVGVCRDFAHLMITMCRALNIPARYTFGYLPDMDVVPIPTPMDFHAWCEVYLGGRWYTFDPRHDALRKGRVVLAHGRDAADTAMVTTYGGPWMQNMTVIAEEQTA